MKLFIAPHNDDEALWGAYSIMREKPVVLIVTDSWIQPNRGEIDCSANARWNETCEAMKLVGAPVIRGRLRDDVLTEWEIKNLFTRFRGFETIYAPAIQGGNRHHDMIGRVAKSVFEDRVIFYANYTKDNPFTTSGIDSSNHFGRVVFEKVSPSTEEVELKEKMLNCYKSQLAMGNKVYFDAVREDGAEYLL